jgi:hypothetical protein
VLDREQSTVGNVFQEGIGRRGKEVSRKASGKVFPGYEYARSWDTALCVQQQPCAFRTELKHT